LMNFHVFWTEAAAEPSHQGQRLALRATRRRTTDMTILTHMGGPSRRTRASARQDTAGTGAAKAHLATIKRFCMGALMVLMAAGALTAVIALKAAIYYWRFHS